MGQETVLCPTVFLTNYWFLFYSRFTALSRNRRLHRRRLPAFHTYTQADRPLSACGHFLRRGKRGRTSDARPYGETGRRGGGPTEKMREKTESPGEFVPWYEFAGDLCSFILLVRGRDARSADERCSSLREAGRRGHRPLRQYGKALARSPFCFLKTEYYSSSKAPV